MEGVRRRVLRVVRRRAQGRPSRVGVSRRITVLIRPLDGPVRTPGQIVVLGFKTSDHGVAPGHVRHRQHPRRLHQVEPAMDSEVEHAVIPLPKVMIGPEQCLHRLRGRSLCAVESTQLLNLVEVLGVLLAGERIGSVGTEL